MDMRSTIFIFGVALIFILPLVISSPISGEDQGRNQAVKNSKNSNEESGLKKVGESCGEGYGKLGWENCGKCAHGLECEKNTFDDQKCMTCKLESDKCIKTWIGGCDNWQSLRIAQYDYHKYSKRECHDLCSSTKSCAGFFISTKSSTYFKLGTCELYRDGCTKSNMNIWDYYAMETCNFDKPICDRIPSSELSVFCWDDDLRELCPYTCQKRFPNRRGI